MKRRRNLLVPSVIALLIWSATFAPAVANDPTGANEDRQPESDVILTDSGSALSMLDKEAEIARLDALTKSIMDNMVTDFVLMEAKLRAAHISMSGAVPPGFRAPGPIGGSSSASSGASASGIGDPDVFEGHAFVPYGNNGANVVFYSETDGGLWGTSFSGSASTSWLGSSPQLHATSISLTESFTLGSTPNSLWLTSGTDWLNNGQLAWHSASVEDHWSLAHIYSGLGAIWGPVPFVSMAAVIHGVHSFEKENGTVDIVRPTDSAIGWLGTL